MTLKEFVGEARTRLRAVYPREEADAVVGIVCSEIIGVQNFYFMVNPDYKVEGAVLSRACGAVDSLAQSEPLQYVLGYCLFYGRKFKVNPDVLIPRPETEILCQYAIKQALMLRRSRSAYGEASSEVRILDLCTGSGCIAWTLALEAPHSVVTGVDICASALKVASAQPFDLPAGTVAPKFVQADIFDDGALETALSGRGPFDIVLSNPPYILRKESASMRSNVLDYEPRIALFVPDDDPMLFNKKIAEIFKKYANTDSIAFVEINDSQSDAVERFFLENGFGQATLISDISGRKRVIQFRAKP